MVRTAYDRETSYSYDSNRFLSAHGKCLDNLENGKLIRVLNNLIDRARVLEVGCGTGRFLQSAYSNRRYSVWGVDPSSFMLTIASNKNPDIDDLHLAHAEGAFLPFSDSTFDLVYSIRVLNQVASHRYAVEMIKEILRVSKRFVLLEFVNKSRLIHKSQRGVQLVVDDIRDVLEVIPSFRIIDVSGILFFSQTALKVTPSYFLGIFMKIDRVLSKRYPQLCSRVYVTLEKESD